MEWTKQSLKRAIPFTALLMALSLLPAQAANIQLEIKEALWELKPGLLTEVWSYNGMAPGTPIVVQQGETVVINGVNLLPVTTNIHWHGLVVPNDQDGPGRVIKPGETFYYKFTVREAGTYWYHSHYRPVLNQVDMGLYGPFIVKNKADYLYSGDHILILDDWYLDSKGVRLDGTARGEMERYGNIESVNGKTGLAITPLMFQVGELHKLRFINASTAAVHSLKIIGHSFRVTHSDGHPLVDPYLTDMLTLSPGERVDVEVAATGREGQTYRIESDRSSLGIVIPIVYRTGKAMPVASPFVPAVTNSISGIEARSPDFVLELNSTMKMSGGPMTGMRHGDHDVSEQPAMLQWTINGKSFPHTDPLIVAVGKVVKIRFWNKDTQMMHKMDHPMHIHGAYFQVVSFNGKKPIRELRKDTINVPAGEYVDVAVIMEYPGEWMVHCHIIDHEDGGMMTRIIAK